ncbi:hypothetical protein AZE42_05251 [Rhizopogon vesiculosus]|uniref:BTB domain-containing protein n=1 Tax=Rhizopogon vesiculosus TaxID=180088 RepID=A0A1J8QN89_9AGAM|nr:hypothetical protein AZE42_05251 [Rhizopogon vesiculosus]
MSDSPQSSPSSGVSKIRNHPQYFIPTGDAEFLTQSVLFKVHRHFFERESEFFKKLFAEGEGDSKPYTLDVSAEDFAHFMWVFYDEEYEYDNHPLERWLVILRLATRWGFQKMRKLAVRQLEKMKLAPIDKIRIYSDFKIDSQLLLPSYASLAMSPTLPSLTDAKKLDIETILKLTMVRERALQKAAEDGCRSPTSASAGGAEVNKIICDIFDLADVNGASTTEPSKSTEHGINGTNGGPVPILGNPDPHTKKNKKNDNVNGTSHADKKR